MGLLGIMFWAPDLDDFTGGLCKEGKYPLMTAAVNVFRGSDSTPLTTTTTMTTTTTTTRRTPVAIAQPPLSEKKFVCYYTK